MKLKLFALILKFFNRKRKYYDCNKKAFSKLNMTYYDDFNDLADNAFAMRNKYRKKIERIIYKRYKRDYKLLEKFEKNERLKL